MCEEDAGPSTWEAASLTHRIAVPKLIMSILVMNGEEGSMTFWGQLDGMPRS